MEGRVERGVGGGLVVDELNGERAKGGLVCEDDKEE